MKIKKSDQDFNTYAVYMDGELIKHSMIVMADDVKGKIVLYKIVRGKPQFIDLNGKVEIKKGSLPRFEF